ncbi:hypothetical protein [Deinococcus pimensis]|uniref:hypothetical protein n=1 Tax=Deinococcus pimensis TaxID=309888 RepID=UPI0004898B95|nr:hypothetical protein [Deinococcus pimensis]
MDASQLRARLEIEAAFRATVDRDVELVAEKHCADHGREEAAARCRLSDDILTDMIWSRFGAFDWDGVNFVYDGTYGHQSRYLWAKVELTVAWAVSNGVFTPEVEEALDHAVTRLRELWREWAGYRATLTDDLALALGD